MRAGAELGAVFDGVRTRFRVWAPRAERVEVVLEGVRLAMERESGGYWRAESEAASPGCRYAFQIDGGTARPDPASRSQPNGVHGPSAVVEMDFAWRDGGWRNPGLAHHVIYELHIGTFTPEGTFDGAIARLDALRELGVTAIELMPVAEFAGGRNWGYDGVCLFAAQSSYGGPDGLRRLVNAAHERGLAVLLDVVYNHIGPEGNYLPEFGPYFTDRYTTPWGEALNFDGPGSDDVRAFFIQNALWWTDQMHIDGLRLDAVHAILDASATPLVRELTQAVHAMAEAQGRRVHVIAESASNDPRVIRPRMQGGFGCDAQWNDDFHHALRTVLTGDRRGYYEPFGRVSQIAEAYRHGFVFTGQNSSVWGRRHGASTQGLPATAFVVFSQNHDQVGNRMNGERPSQIVDFESLKLAAAAVLLSPFVPMLFMGEEWAATTPFQYFVSHTDPELIEAVREGRAAEFESFEWRGELPDPQAKQTFEQSKLNWQESEAGSHATMKQFYRRLCELRRSLGLGTLDAESRRVECDDAQGVVVVSYDTDGGRVVLTMNFSETDCMATVEATEPLCVLLDSAAEQWGGPSATADPVSKGGGLSRVALARRSARLFSEGSRKL